MPQPPWGDAVVQPVQPIPAPTALGVHVTLVAPMDHTVKLWARRRGHWPHVCHPRPADRRQCRAWRKSRVVKGQGCERGVSGW